MDQNKLAELLERIRFIENEVGKEDGGQNTITRLTLKSASDSEARVEVERIVYMPGHLIMWKRNSFLVLLPLASSVGLVDIVEKAIQIHSF